MTKGKGDPFLLKVSKQQTGLYTQPKGARPARPVPPERTFRDPEYLKILAGITWLADSSQRKKRH
jgi:hypothetical protein